MINRRKFFSYCLFATTVSFFKNGFGNDLSRTLYFYNIHTGEFLKETYWEDGNYISSDLTKINYILRDFRNNEIKPIDINLIDLLYIIKSQLDFNKPIHIISGYRSLTTNEFLRKVSTGVASKSMHLEGKAVDIYMPGIPLNILRDTAKNLKAGGVGYYPSSNFVHIDTGKVRFW